MIQLWDRVRLKAGGDSMRVLQVVPSCAGDDGAGLFCMWEDNEKYVTGWISESSVEMAPPSRRRDDPDRWDNFAFSL